MSLMLDVFEKQKIPTLPIYEHFCIEICILELNFHSGVKFHRKDSHNKYKAP